MIDEIELNNQGSDAEPTPSSNTPAAAATAAAQASNTANHLARIECLHRLLESVAEWCRIFFALPAVPYFEMPTFVVSYQMARVFQILYYLTFLNEPDWDCQQVRSKIDFFESMANVASGLEKMQHMLESDDEDDQLNVKPMVKNLREDKSNLEKEYQSRQAKVSPFEGLGLSQEQNMAFETIFGAMGSSMNFFGDDQWSNDAMGFMGNMSQGQWGEGNSMG